jgi:hypothetical protein
MGIYDEIIAALRGNRCNRFVKILGQEISITGVKGGFNDISIDAGAFSNKYVEFYKVNDVLVALDTNQYALCQFIESLPQNDPFRRDCEKMRLQTILGFSQLQALLDLKNDERFKDEIEKWINYMTDLTITQISALSPAQPIVHDTRITAGPHHGADEHKGFTRDGGFQPRNDLVSLKDDLKRIGKYQGINEMELEKSLNK